MTGLSYETQRKAILTLLYEKIAEFLRGGSWESLQLVRELDWDLKSLQRERFDKQALRELHLQPPDVMLKRVPVRYLQKQRQRVVMSAGALEKDAVLAVRDVVLNQERTQGMTYVRELDRQALRSGRKRPRGYRIPVGLYTCGWCVMMASRGPIFLEENAGTLDTWHKGCDCAFLLASSETKYAHASQVKRYRKLYEDAKKYKQSHDNAPSVASLIERSLRAA